MNKQRQLTKILITDHLGQNLRRYLLAFAISIVFFGAKMEGYSTSSGKVCGTVGFQTARPTYTGKAVNGWMFYLNDGRIGYLKAPGAFHFEDGQSVIAEHRKSILLGRTHYLLVSTVDGCEAFGLSPTS